MGIADILSSVLGTQNSYQAGAPKNDFNATGANLDESSYSDAIKKALAAATGGGSSAAGDQSALAAALKAQMAGQGPSLAQRQLEQATQANTAQAAGSIAGAKGINPALAARLVSQNQAASNQAAAGQSATLRQSEQLGTEGLLAQALQAQRGQDINQQQANTTTAGTAGQLQNQQNATRVQNKLGSEQINATVGEGNANRQLGSEQINAGVSAQNTNTNSGLVGGLLSGAGSLLGLAEGGAVPDLSAVVRAILAHAKGYAGGGDIPQITIPDYSHMLSEGGDSLRSAFGGMGKGKGKGPGTPTDVSTGSPLAAFSPQGSPTAAPWEGAAPLLTTGVPFAAGGGEIAAALRARDFRAGGKVPGRAAVQGDSPKNDTVPAVVSPGEVVLPRSVTQADDAPDKAAAFVAAVKAKKKGAAPTGYGKVLAAQRALAERVGAIEARFAGGRV